MSYRSGKKQRRDMGATAAIYGALTLQRKKRGRPRQILTLLTGLKPKKVHGRPIGSVKYSEDDLRWLLERVETCKIKLTTDTQRKRRITDAEALRAVMVEEYRSRGYSEWKVGSLANKNLPRLKTLLSRMKNRSKHRS